MSAFDTYRQMRDSTLRNGEAARAEAIEGEQRNALAQAGQMYAGGNGSGARNALLQSGMIDEGLALGRYDAQQAQAATAQQQALQDRHYHAIGQGALGLRRLPAAQRWQAFQNRVLPVLQAEGVDQALLAGITQEDLASDQSLDSIISLYGGEVEAPSYQSAGGGYFLRSDPYGGGEPQFIQAPVDPLDVRLREAQIRAQEALAGQRTASGNAATARAARSGGGGRRGGGSGTSSAAPRAPAGNPWDRDY